MVDDAAGVKGYTFGRPGHLYRQLGPVVAADAGTARELVTRCLSQLGGRAFAIDAPLLDGEWLDFLKSVGFVEERRFVRMFLRGHRPSRNSGAAVRDMRPGICVKGPPAPFIWSQG